MVAQVHSENLTFPLESSRGRIRVLHIVENLDSQAVESWLLRVLRASREDYPQVHWAFFCTLGREGRLDNLARSLGADVIYAQHEIGDKVRFIRSLREVMKRGRYEILHCHHDVMSAAYLLASQGLSFQKRIVHVHNTSLSLPTPNRLKASLAREPMRQMCLRMADQIVGISKDALESMVGNRVTDPERYRVVHYAVDTDRFGRVRFGREAFRRSLGLAHGAKVLLFVGRVVSYKNPCFVVDILEVLAKIRPDVVAVFAGAGNQEEEVLAMARRKTLPDRVRVLGFRDDVPELMANSDVLIWPSLEDPKEGLGLGIVEAQAAGLPILTSGSVPTEAIVVPELVDVLPLSAGAEAWSERVAEILDRPRIRREESRARVESSSFSMAEGVKNMISLYDRTRSQFKHPRQCAKDAPGSRMKRVNYITNLDLNQRTGGWSGINVSLHDMLSKRFELNSIGAINPGNDYPAKALSKLRRRCGLAGTFHFFSTRRLKRISSIVAERADPSADCDFFHGSTPWILFDSPRPYFVYVDTCFSTYVDVYHERLGFIQKDLQRIYDAESGWLSRAAGVFFGTQWALEQVVNNYGISQANLRVVGAAGSLELPRSDRHKEGAIRLLFIALDFEQKGGRICVDAFRRVKAQVPEAQLTIVGGRPNDEILELPGISYEGFLSKSIPADLNRLEELYATAFALIHPTSSDIQPLVISEAGYFGCPSIAPARFGIPELIDDGITGFLMGLPLNANEIAKRIVQLTTDKDTYARMRKAVRTNAIANQTWQAVGDRIVREMARSSGNGCFTEND